MTTKHKVETVTSPNPHRASSAFICRVLPSVSVAVHIPLIPKLDELTDSFGYPLNL